MDEWRDLCNTIVETKAVWCRERLDSGAEVDTSGFCLSNSDAGFKIMRIERTADGAMEQSAPSDSTWRCVHNYIREISQRILIMGNSGTISKDKENPVPASPFAANTSAVGNGAAALVSWPLSFPCSIPPERICWQDSRTTCETTLRINASF